MSTPLALICLALPAIAYFLPDKRVELHIDAHGKGLNEQVALDQFSTPPELGALAVLAAQERQATSCWRPPRPAPASWRPGRGVWRPGDPERGQRGSLGSWILQPAALRREMQITELHGQLVRAVLAAFGPMRSMCGPWSVKI